MQRFILALFFATYWVVGCEAMDFSLQLTMPVVTVTGDFTKANPISKGYVPPFSGDKPEAFDFTQSVEKVTKKVPLRNVFVDKGWGMNYAVNVGNTCNDFKNNKAEMFVPVTVSRVNDYQNSSLVPKASDDESYAWCQRNKQIVLLYKGKAYNPWQLSQNPLVMDDASVSDDDLDDYEDQSIYWSQRAKSYSPLNQREQRALVGKDTAFDLVVVQHNAAIKTIFSHLSGLEELGYRYEGQKKLPSINREGEFRGDPVRGPWDTYAVRLAPGRYILMQNAHDIYMVTYSHRDDQPTVTPLKREYFVDLVERKVRQDTQVQRVSLMRKLSYFNEDQATYEDEQAAPEGEAYMRDHRLPAIRRNFGDEPGVAHDLPPVLRGASPSPPIPAGPGLLLPPPPVPSPHASPLLPGPLSPLARRRSQSGPAPRSHHKGWLGAAGGLGVFSLGTAGAAFNRYSRVQELKRMIADLQGKKESDTRRKLRRLIAQRNAAQGWMYGSGAASALSLLGAILAARHGWHGGESAAL